MKLTFTPDWLVMRVDAEEQESLRRLQAEDPDQFDRDDTLYDLFESLLANSEFSWVTEGLTADLTSAPMLGIFGEPEPAPDKSRFDLEDFYGSGLNPIGCWDRQIWCQPLLFRWAFMDYAVTSPQRALAEHGQAVWSGGEYLTRDGNAFPCDREIGLRMLSSVD